MKATDLALPGEKLIRRTRGSLFDVAIDLQKGSPTYKKRVSEILSAENRKRLYIPKDKVAKKLAESDVNLVYTEAGA